MITFDTLLENKLLKKTFGSLYLQLCGQGELNLSSMIFGFLHKESHHSQNKVVIKTNVVLVTETSSLVYNN